MDMIWSSWTIWQVYVAVYNFLFQLISIFFFVSNSLAYIIVPKNNGKEKINWDKKLTTTYVLKFKMIIQA